MGFNKLTGRLLEECFFRLTVENVEFHYGDKGHYQAGSWLSEDSFIFHFEPNSLGELPVL